jgi:cAMP-dependent protein kinase regulator
VAKNSGFDGFDELARATHELARQQLAKGQWAAAQLVAAIMLEANPEDHRAWYLLGQALAAAGHEKRAQRAFVTLAQAYGRRGDLPMAIVALAEGAGSERQKSLGQLAAAYSNSARALVDNWRPTPPPMPQRVDVDLSAAEQPAVVEQRVEAALKAAEGLLGHKPASERRFFPLFSSLSPDAFVRLAERLEILRLPADHTVLEQGHQGKNFFVIAEGEVRVLRRHAQTEATLLARLGAGAFFGEMAIISRAPRAASVETVTEVTLLRANMDLLRQEKQNTPEIGQVLTDFCRSRMLENVLMASPILRQIPAAQRAGLLAQFKEMKHRPGEVIIREGTEAAGLFLLVSGEVTVSKLEEGEVLAIARLGPGDYFGEISMVLRRPTVASVTADSRTVSLFLPQDAFLAAIRDFPQLLSELYETALRRDQETSSVLACEALDADDLILL